MLIDYTYIGIFQELLCITAKFSTRCCQAASFLLGTHTLQFYNRYTGQKRKKNRILYRDVFIYILYMCVNAVQGYNIVFLRGLVGLKLTHSLKVQEYSGTVQGQATPAHHCAALLKNLFFLSTQRKKKYSLFIQHIIHLIYI